MNAYDVSALALAAAGIYDLTRGHKKWGWGAIGLAAVAVYLSGEQKRKLERETAVPPSLQSGSQPEVEFEEIGREQYRGFTLVYFGRGYIVWEVRDESGTVSEGVGEDVEDAKTQAHQAVDDLLGDVDA